MSDWSQLLVFTTTALVIAFVPGPNTLYIIANSVENGRRAGVVSSLGVQLGTIFHIFAAAIGLSAVLVSSAFAFSLVKYAGAAYLIYLGVKTLLAKEKVENDAETRPKSYRNIFLRGAVVNIFNPKTALFFFAFLPQFLDPGRGSLAAQIIPLGLILIVCGTLSDLLYAFASGSIGNFLRGNRKFFKAQKYFAGLVYLGLGAGTLFAGTREK